MTTKTAIKVTGDLLYEVVGTLSGGAELRRYTFFDRSVHSVIFVDGSVKEATPIEKEDKLIAWWETEIEYLRRYDDGEGEGEGNE